MGRAQRFSRAQILDAAFALAAERGTAGVTVHGVAAAVGAPSGSLYHRYASRDHLLADLWLEAVEDFQHEFLGHLDDKDDAASAARAAARAVVLWSMRAPDRAAVLMLFRRTDLIGDRWPPEVQERAAQAGESLERALRQFEKRAGVTRGPDSRKLRFCLIDAPYAVVRGALQRGRPLARADADLIDEIVAAILVTIRGVGAPKRMQKTAR